MDANYMRGSGWAAKLSPRNLLKKRQNVILLLVGVPVFLFITFSPRGLVTRISLENQTQDLRDSLAIATEHHAQLEKLARDLYHDLRAIETVARVKYGMVKPGETVYKVKKGS